mgnify:CR=1 FL=1
MFKKVDSEYFYRLLHPRPVVLVAVKAQDGRVNFMACSWVTPVSEDPPLIALALSRESYTRDIILEVKEFTVNIPSLQLLEEVWISGTTSGREVDKVAKTGVELGRAENVSAPVIQGSIGYLECKLKEYHEVGECTLIVGEVIGAYARENTFERGTWRLEKTSPLLHLGSVYFTTANRYTVKPASLKKKKKRS